MQLRFFTIPAFDSVESEIELNKFLRSHRILQMERHFCPDNNGYWAVVVEYMESVSSREDINISRAEKRNVTKDLSLEEMERFDYFKKIRKQVAQEKSIPAYLVFTDAELAVLAKIPDLGVESVSQIKGVAPQRLKDNLRFFYLVRDGEAGGQLDAQNRGDGKPA